MANVPDRPSQGIEPEPPLPKLRAITQGYQILFDNLQSLPPGERPPPTVVIAPGEEELEARRRLSMPTLNNLKTQ